MRRTENKAGKMIRTSFLYGCFFLLFFCGYFIYQTWQASHKIEEEYEQMQQEATEENTQEEETEEQMELPITVYFAPLFKENSDLVAWIYFKNGEIDHPVVQTSDNSTYLKKTFEGETGGTVDL